MIWLFTASFMMSKVSCTFENKVSTSNTVNSFCCFIVYDISINSHVDYITWSFCIFEVINALYATYVSLPNCDAICWRGGLFLSIFFFFAFLVKKTSGILFLAQAFANLHGKRRQGKFIWKTRIYMLQTCKHDVAKLIFQEVLIF